MIEQLDVPAANRERAFINAAKREAMTQTISVRPDAFSAVPSTGPEYGVRSRVRGQALGLGVLGPSRESHVNGSERLGISEPKMSNSPETP